jgi:hypothetical protein
MQQAKTSAKDSARRSSDTEGQPRVYIEEEVRRLQELDFLNAVSKGRTLTSAVDSEASLDIDSIQPMNRKKMERRIVSLISG